jgi:putative PIN family toxin of toxin-antitoxin system
VRIVVDTNVVVSALLQPLGNPGRVVTLMRLGVIVPVYDARILAEYREVCGRPRLRLVPEDVERLVTDVVQRGELLDEVPRAAFALPDPDDQPFLDVALAGGTEAIVTGNRKDFPEACGVRVLSPAELVQLLAPLE